MKSWRIALFKDGARQYRNTRKVRLKARNMYAKLINEHQIDLCPQEIIEDTKRMIGFTEDAMNKRGYYKLILQERDEDMTKLRYEKQDNTIIQIWE